MNDPDPVSDYDQVRIAEKYLLEATQDQIGYGQNPVSFLCTSHAELRRRCKVMSDTLKNMAKYSDRSEAAARALKEAGYEPYS